MARFELNILGCGAATPTQRHSPSAQVVNVRDKLFMVDCGEGVQLNWRRMKLNMSRLGHIFISHLHGDHCFGLPGLLSTMSLLGHGGEMVIHAHPDFEQVFMPFLQYFCREMTYTLRFEPFYMTSDEPIYSDKGLVVKTMPLRHRIPACGFLFEEQPGERHLRGDVAKFYDIPVTALADIKRGADYVLPDGRVIPNDHLTTPPTPPARYAYCCDTAYSERIIPYIEGVDVLYHDATYGDDAAQYARQTLHSTARQAATIAREAKVGQLILGHFSGRYRDESILLDEARQVFENTVLAHEGMRCVLRR